MDLTPDQRALRDSVDRFIRAEIAPRISAMEKAREVPREVMERCAELGLVGATLPEEAGGLGLGFRDLSVLMETVGYHWHSLRSLLNVANMVAALIHENATAEQRERFLAPALSGKARVFVAITEPNHGSDVNSIELRAQDRRDHFRLNGRKLWITNGGGDFGIVLARVTDPAGGRGKLTTFLVDPKESAFEVRRVDTMILRATQTTELTFDDTIVPRANVLGEVGGGLRNILTTLAHGRVSVASGAVGAAQAALDITTEYARTRRQFGRLIGEQQLVQGHLAEMVALTRAARWLVYDAAVRLDRGETARLETSLAKRQATEWAHRVAHLALQLHGGIGYSEDLPIERIFRDTRGGTIPEGTSEIQSLVIGRELLGLDAFNAAKP
ncbi:acyl-CoA dehydrogenase family protein [Futiania mangrovi]|uniref:Acyl-CoA dehydrogenase family protein n=1 Tax=Futiania mangrovi TaxID=2959716 RepID=A0A9J6PEK7_9PROT|nr:acyl-CoA dehydrogenase family protein [Futiania mangrovii]MCP1336264.1 acyl-CoA dehydrogenase family protein [Futiania mangrovii]